MVYKLLNFLTFLIPMAVYIYILVYLFGYQFRNDKSKKVFTIIISVYTAVEVVFIFVLKNKEISDLFFEVPLIASAPMIPVVFLNTKKKFNLILFGLTYCTTIDYLCVFISSAFGREDVTDKIIYLLICVFIMCAAVIISKKSAINSQRIFPVESISPLLYLVMMISELSMYYDVVFSEESPLYKSVSFGLKIFSGTVIILGLYYFAANILKLMYKQRETDRILNDELIHYEEVMKKNDLLRKFRHDYQNNLFSLSVLINADQFSDAKEYINNLTEKLSETSLSFTTGNYLADAILSEKNEVAAKNSVAIEFNGKIPAEGINNLDLCTVLANLRDNAVQGCAGCVPCTINIDSYVNSSSFVMNIRNPVKENLKIANNTIATTKSDSENHGFGLKNVENVVKKYNGFFEIKCEKNIFQASVGFILNH